MVYNKIYIQIICILLSNIPIYCYQHINYDQTSTRTNTLSDDADDIQPQLDNEARDKLKYNRLPTIWVFHRPLNNSTCPPVQLHSTILLKDLRLTTKEMNKYPKTTRYRKKKSNHLILRDSSTKMWEYSYQDEWYKKYPQCAGLSQSPVDLPTRGLVIVKGCKILKFYNYDVNPISLTLHNDGRRYILTGTWNDNEKPVIHGGAAFGRRYVFHSITLHWPSEHKIGGMVYPFETQVLHISAEYKTLEEAITASSNDPLSILGVVNIYMFKNHTECGLLDILNNMPKIHSVNTSIPLNPLSYFNPPMKDYVCYQGSLTTPPCTESVLWFVRGSSLAISRETYNFANSLLDGEDLKTGHGRQPHPLNDRKLYFVNRGN